MARDPHKKWNYIRDFFADHCDAPLTVYAEAAFPAALNALISYYQVDPVEIFTGYFRPDGGQKGKRGGSHATGGSRRGKGSKGAGVFKKAMGFDPNEWIAKKLPGADEMSKRQVPGGATAGWAVYGAIQRAQYWMMVYEITEDFFYEWTSGVASSIYCQNQFASVLFAISRNQGHFGLLYETPLVMNEILKRRNITYADGNGVLPGIRQYHVSVSWSDITPWGGEGEAPPVEVVIRSSTGIEHVTQMGSGGGSGMVAGLFNDDSSVYFFTRGPYSCFLQNLEFSVHGFRDEPGVRRKGWRDLFNMPALNWSDIQRLGRTYQEIVGE